jgi:hypothetical protein
MPYIASPQPEDLRQDICSFVEKKHLAKTHIYGMHDRYYANSNAINDPSDHANDWMIEMLDGFINEELTEIAPKNQTDGPSYAYINMFRRHRAYVNTGTVQVYLFIVEQFDNGNIRRFPNYVRFNIVFGLMTPAERIMFIDNLLARY